MRCTDLDPVTIPPARIVDPRSLLLLLLFLVFLPVPSSPVWAQHPESETVQEPEPFPQHQKWFGERAFLVWEYDRFQATNMVTLVTSEAGTTSVISSPPTSTMTMSSGARCSPKRSSSPMSGGTRRWRPRSGASPS
jgi:hypothetical protein